MRGENEFGLDIPDQDLMLADVPPAGSSDWSAISGFALTYDGYGLSGFEACAKVANDASKDYVLTGQLPTTLSALRTCLFFEQRRWHHFGRSPDESAMRYVRALLEAVRAQLSE